MASIVEQSDIATVPDLLSRGGVIVYPTETVYGIGCLSNQDGAIERVAAIKGSKPGASFIILVKSIEQAWHYCQDIPDPTFELVAVFWPGPLTLVLPASKHLPGRLVGPGGGVALRCSPHPLVGNLLAQTESGLISTSANPSGFSAPVRIETLDSSIKDQVDLIINGGTLNGSVSTVVDLTIRPMKLLREGAITREQLKQVVGKSIT